MDKQTILQHISKYCNEDNLGYAELALQKVVNNLISEFRQNVFFYTYHFTEPIVRLPFEVAYFFEITIDNKRVELLKLENITPYTKGVVLLDFERLRIYGYESGTLNLSACVFWDRSNDIPLSPSFSNAILSGCEILLRHHHFDMKQIQFLQIRHEQDKDELRAFYNRATTKSATQSQNVRI
ncbi:hypothetical protein [Helicobacter equorum]|uniref:hypothetical protein n=1 Tax=Helicobacter equorum TaxID=361872 RepID=UPI000CF10A96|nr:hypothetical protein [Helicobacter equorum]